MTTNEARPASPAAEGVVPMAELHVHLEGTVTLAQLVRFAERNGVASSHPILRVGPRSAWRSFEQFLAAYDAAASCLRHAEDFREITLAYLLALARHGAIYAELTISPDHAALGGVTLTDQIEAVGHGIDAARRRSGIEARIIVTAVRHFGVPAAQRLVDQVLEYDHPLVTGLGLAGDERVPASEFRSVFERAREAGLGCTAHAGETRGPESVRDALMLPILRIGHGVRAIEDPALVGELARRRIVLECCPGSNVALGIYRGPVDHPLRALHEAGVRVTVSSDDPPFFDTTIATEYAFAADALAGGERELPGLTRTALECAFVDEGTRARLLARLAAATDARDRVGPWPSR
jgi:adenosine deaminase